MKNLTHIQVTLRSSSSATDAEVEAMQIELDDIDLPAIVTKALRLELDARLSLKDVKVTAVVHGG
jgi:hypothetical protein